MRVDLYRDPKVCALADMMMYETCDLARYVRQNMQADMCVTRNVMRNAVVGALLSVWGVMRSRGKRSGDDLFCRGMTPAVIDDIAELQGFGTALVAIGWVDIGEGCIVFPRFFEEHNTDPADTARQKNAERQQRFRDKKNNVTRDVTVTRREEKRREEKKTPPKPPEGFEEFWAVYPRKVSKPQAERAWRKLKPDTQTVQAIVAGVRRDGRSDQWLSEGGRFVPYPATWLNGRRWEDGGDVQATERPWYARKGYGSAAAAIADGHRETA